jgi:hypothetical protein
MAGRERFSVAILARTFPLSPRSSVAMQVPTLQRQQPGRADAEVLSDWWAERLNAYSVVKDQRITKNADGKYMFEGSVNSINGQLAVESCWLMKKNLYCRLS